jgi:hypothetical protein
LKFIAPLKNTLLHASQKTRFVITTKTYCLIVSRKTVAVHGATNTKPVSTVSGQNVAFQKKNAIQIVRAVH